MSGTIDYELNGLIKQAIEEGIKPVILTGRFLLNLTSQGFIWLPGIKCSKGNDNVDFDIFACCDSILVAGECKSLRKSKERSRVWNEIIEQLEKEITFAKTLGVQVFAVSVMCDSFPKSFKKNIESIAGKEMSVLFLNSKDLQEGLKVMQHGETKSILHLDDILPSNQKRKKKKLWKGRIVRFKG